MELSGSCCAPNILAHSWLPKLNNVAYFRWQPSTMVSILASGPSCPEFDHKKNLIGKIVNVAQAN